MRITALTSGPHAAPRWFASISLDRICLALRCYMPN